MRTTMLVHYIPPFLYKTNTQKSYKVDNQLVATYVQLIIIINLCSPFLQLVVAGGLTPPASSFMLATTVSGAYPLSVG